MSKHKLVKKLRLQNKALKAKIKTLKAEAKKAKRIEDIEFNRLAELSYVKGCSEKEIDDMWKACPKENQEAAMKKASRFIDENFIFDGGKYGFH